MYFAILYQFYSKNTICSTRVIRLFQSVSLCVPMIVIQVLIGTSEFNGSEYM